MAEAHPVLRELLDRAERSPWVPDDTKSGARFERVTVDGERFVLKYQDPRDDWLLRATGDPGRAYVLLWESGLLDRLPAVLDHTVVAAAFDGTVGMVLLRDVSAALLDGDAAFTAVQHARFMEHMAALHATFWGWRDDVGLTSLRRRYLMFSPAVALAEAARGNVAVVPQAMAEGWRRLPEVSAPVARVVLPLLADPTPLVDALARLPHTLVHGDWKAANLGSHPDGRTVLLDFGEAPGEASPLADLSWYLALNAALLPEPKDAVLESYRQALEGCGVPTAAWWDAAVALEMLGCMLQFGWEKALGGPGDELSWWEEWVQARCAGSRRTGLALARSGGTRPGVTPEKGFRRPNLPRRGRTDPPGRRRGRPPCAGPRRGRRGRRRPVPGGGAARGPDRPTGGAERLRPGRAPGRSPGPGARGPAPGHDRP